MIYFTAHTIKCVCHSIRTMFGVLGLYNFAPWSNKSNAQPPEGDYMKFVLICLNTFCNK